MASKKPFATSYHALDRREPWSPSNFDVPALGAGALLISISGVVVSIAVLVASNQKPISEWRFQPTVYLAIASTITNITLHFALAQGVTIAWWRKSLTSSTTLGELHRYWDHGNSLWTAMTAGQRLSIISMACILVSTTPINGPLLQRASRVTSVELETAKLLKLNLAPVVPPYSTGYISSRSETVALLTRDFLPVVQDFYAQNPIRLKKTDCQGVCKGRVRGAGFAVKCGSNTAPFNISIIVDADDSLIHHPATVFSTSFNYELESEYPTVLTLGIQLKNTTDCPTGLLTTHNCSLYAGTVAYPVIIDGAQSTISLDPDTTIWDDQVYSIMYDQPVEYYGSPGTTLGGVFYILSTQYNSISNMGYDGSTGFEQTVTGSTVMQYAHADKVDVKTEIYTIGGSCNNSFIDPLDDLLASARDLMFRTAIALANDTNIQTMYAHQTMSQTRYESDYVYLAFATLASILAVCIVAFTFNGYGELGRRFSMSPIETAKALNAPLLRNEDSNAEVAALVRELGHLKVKYGVVEIKTNSTASQQQQIRNTNSSATDNPPLARLEIADPVQSVNHGLENSSVDNKSLRKT